MDFNFSSFNPNLGIGGFSVMCLQINRATASRAGHYINHRRTALSLMHIITKSAKNRESEPNAR